MVKYSHLARRAVFTRGRTGEELAQRAPRSQLREANERTLLAAAEAVFAERGFDGATTAEIAARAGVPKSNLHYYFPTKETLYRAVVSRILTLWLAAAESFDSADDPRVALAAYIGAKMDLSREMPQGARVWASEIMRGAPIIRDFLDTTLTHWVESRGKIIRKWIAEGKLRPIEPKTLFYLIWAATQHYAYAAHEIAALNGGAALSDSQFAAAKRQLTAMVLDGVAPEAARKR